NEHCANVGRARAMRDPELPYAVSSPKPVPASGAQAEMEQFPVGAGEVVASPAAPLGTLSPLSAAASASASGRDLEAGAPTPAERSLRLRKQSSAAGGKGAGGEEASPVYRALQRVGTTILTAHAFDYERRRKPAGEEKAGTEAGSGGEEDSEDEDEDSDGEV
ncbi:Xenotropic and polytropic retrovirus receptor 1, partial [Teratosphaeriaceae sp. CCFEE 6253]